MEEQTKPHIFTFNNRRVVLHGKSHLVTLPVLATQWLVLNASTEVDMILDLDANTLTIRKATEEHHGRDHITVTGGRTTATSGDPQDQGIPPATEPATTEGGDDASARQTEEVAHATEEGYPDEHPEGLDWPTSDHHDQ